MSSTVLPMVLSSTAVLFTAITAVFSVLAYAKVIGMEKSTHTIQWQPVPEDPENPGQTGKELLKGLAPEGEYQFYDEEGFREK